MDKGIKLILWYVICVFAILMLTIGLFSCNPVKKANKYYEKAKKASVITVAQRTRQDWPCVTTKVDTVHGKDSVVIRDTTIYQQVYADCPDTAKNAAPGKTIKVPILVQCNCKDSIVYRPLYITNTVEDSANIFIANTERDKALKKSEKYERRAHTKTAIIAVLIGLFALYLLLTRMFKLF